MRLKQLDVLRGIAILLVLGRHMTEPGPGIVLPIRVLGDVWHQVGWIGVDLFFVLSGFLISGLLFAEHRRHGRLRVGRFLVRRGFKIYPAFYAMLATTVLVEVYHRGWGAALDRHFVAEALYLQGYLNRFWWHTWSLAVEEHFYALLPLVLWLILRRRGTLEGLGRAFTVAVLGLGVVTLALRLWTWERYTVDRSVFLYATHLRLSSLAWGVLLGYWYHHHREALIAFLTRHGRTVAAASAALLAPAFVYPELTTGLFTFGYPCIAWGFGGLLALSLVGADRPRQGRPRAGVRTWPGRALAAIGVSSYSIYLWHMPVKTWALMHLADTRLFRALTPTAAYVLEFALYVGGCLLVGFLTARMIEMPALALRERWFPSRTSAVGPAAGVALARPVGAAQAVEAAGARR